MTRGNRNQLEPSPLLAPLRRRKELQAFEELIEDFAPYARVRRLAEVEYVGESFPIHVVVVGSERPTDPSLGFFAGVHGLERIGSEVLMAYMRTVLSLLRWDRTFHKRLEHSRLVFMPIVNPVGVSYGRRSNGHGVDLMRNAPVRGDAGLGLLFRGHRLSPHLPWYRGPAGAAMEVEARALCQAVREELLPSEVAMSLDIHSGFGAIDRLWFPYARTRRPIPRLAEVDAIRDLIDTTHPHHFYRIEPVSRQYTIHGDLWDYLFDQSRYEEVPCQFFLPWTLEMGSWLWIKKNPLQIFNRDGAFHPTVPHRYQRILRRHALLFDLLHRLVLHPEVWCLQSASARRFHQRRALERWFQ